MSCGDDDDEGCPSRAEMHATLTLQLETERISIIHTRCGMDHIIFRASKRLSAPCEAWPNEPCTFELRVTADTAEQWLDKNLPHWRLLPCDILHN